MSHTVSVTAKSADGARSELRLCLPSGAIVAGVIAILGVGVIAATIVSLNLIGRCQPACRFELASNRVVMEPVAEAALGKLASEPEGNQSVGLRHSMTPATTLAAIPAKQPVPQPGAANAATAKPRQSGTTVAKAAAVKSQGRPVPTGAAQWAWPAAITGPSPELAKSLYERIWSAHGRT